MPAQYEQNSNLDCRAVLESLYNEKAESMDLLQLLCCLGGVDVPMNILWRASMPRRAWNIDGEIVDIVEPDLHINRLFDTNILEQSIERLKVHGILIEKGESWQDKTLTIVPQMRLDAKGRLPLWNDWRLQAMILVCHTFPRDRDLESLLGILSPHIKLLMAETLIAASCFSDSTWKFKVLDMAEHILSIESDPYLEMWAFLRRGMLTRLYPGTNDNESKGSPQCNVLDNRFPYDRRSDAQFMELILARAFELMEKGKYTEAQFHLELIDVSKEDSPSTMERIVLRRKEFAIARILRFQGRFLEALNRLHVSKWLYPKSTKGYYSVLAHMADILTELGEPIKAAEMMASELQAGKADDRNLRVSLAEAKLHAKCFQEAEEICHELKLSYEATIHPDKKYCIFYFRVLTILARSAHLQGRLPEAFAYWESCLTIIDTRIHGWHEKGFSYMITVYSISDIELKTGILEKAREHLAEAREIFKTSGRGYWCTGLGTFWLDAIGTSIVRLGKRRIDAE